MKHQLTIIAAVAKNKVIGKENGLPWSLPDDWNRLKYLVKDKSIVMGRKTFESEDSFTTQKINFILSKSDNLSLPDNCIQCRNVGELMEKMDEDVVVLGGGQIYKELLPYSSRMMLTRVEAEAEGEVEFPPVDYNGWELMQSVYHPPDEKHKHGFYFEDYIRKR